MNVGMVTRFRSGEKSCAQNFEKMMNSSGIPPSKETSVEVELIVQRLFFFFEIKMLLVMEVTTMLGRKKGKKEQKCRY
jgi:uncharacterized membrane protein